MLFVRRGGRHLLLLGQKLCPPPGQSHPAALEVGEVLDAQHIAEDYAEARKFSGRWLTYLMILQCGYLLL
jgi:hypothetical protein